MARFRSLIPFDLRSSTRAFDPFEGMRQEMDRLLEEFGRAVPAQNQGRDAFLLPKVDVAETDSGIELTAELPGFEEKDVSVDLHDGVLTIKAEHSDEREEKDDERRWHVIERSHGSFMRRFSLPFEADADKVAAHLDNGVLTVSVPRLAVEEKKPKKIAVSKKSGAAKMTKET